LGLNFIMAKFVTKNIPLVEGRQQFKQLIIVEDHVDAVKLQVEIVQKEANGQEVEMDGVLDLYEKSLEAKYKSSFRSIIAVMNRVANMESVANDKFKDITPDKVVEKEYEFKHQDLRVYAIKIFTGKLILICGFKNQQRNDIAAFRMLKQRYLESLQKKENKK
jgi:hypothetical protein